jgi:hypothetical protein
MLPEAADDHVGADNPIRPIDAFVDAIDLSAAGFLPAAPQAADCAGDAPGELLRLCTDGSLSRMRMISSGQIRRLAP